MAILSVNVAFRSEVNLLANVNLSFPSDVTNVQLINRRSDAISCALSLVKCVLSANSEDDPALHSQPNQEVFLTVIPSLFS